MDKTEKTVKTAQLDPKAMLAHLVLMDKMEKLYCVGPRVIQEKKGLLDKTERMVLRVHR